MLNEEFVAYPATSALNRREPKNGRALSSDPVRGRRHEVSVAR